MHPDGQLLIEHLQNVSALAAHFAAGFGAAAEGAYAGMLHDIGKFLEYDIKDGKACHSEMGKYYNHVVSGAYIAKSNGLPDKIVHMILEHSDMQSPANTYDYPELMMMKKLDHMCFSIAWMAYPCK